MEQDILDLDDPQENAALRRLLDKFPDSMRQARFPRYMGDWPGCAYEIRKRHVGSLSFYMVKMDEWQLLTAFSRLQRLSMSIDKDPSFPESLFTLKSLSMLHLDVADCIKIPDKFHRLPRLTHLQISQGNSSRLPPSIGCLKNLEYLAFWGFDLESLPDWLGGLERLKYLVFNSARISELPEYFKQLPLRKISIFGAGNFKCLPEILREIPTLCEVNWSMDNTRFEEIYNNSSEKMRSWWKEMIERMRRKYRHYLDD
ncbi:MAG: leucine-rich repeat domain-containing protein [Candidatus Sigynarchaeota archaeon]